MGKTFLYKDGKATLFMDEEVEAALADGWKDHPDKKAAEPKKTESVKKETSIQQKVLDEKEKFLDEKEKALDRKEAALDEKENFLEGIEKLIEDDNAKAATSGATTKEQVKNE